MTSLRLSCPLVVLFLVIPFACADEPKPARVDLFGDPLPPCAVARLGTMRLRYATCMAFSPDGKMIATAQRNVVHVWDAETGKELRCLMAPSSVRSAFSAAFSPDGRKIAVLDNLGIDIVVWRVDKEAPLFTTRIKQLNSSSRLKTCRIAFSPDSKTLYTGNDQTVHAWDAESGKEKYRFQHERDTGAERRINTIVFSRDGKLFATANDSQSAVRIWDTYGGKLLHVLHGHTQGAHCAAFSHDARLLAVGGFDRIVHLWDVKSGKEIRRLEGHADEVAAVAFSLDAKELATANPEPFFSDVDAILLWDLTREASSSPRKIAAPGVKSLEYSPDGKTLAWICRKHTVHPLGARTGEECILFERHNGEVNSVAYSPNGRLIVTAGSDRVIRLWEPDTGKPKGVLRGHHDAVNAVAFSPDGKWLASASNDGTAILWDVENQRIRFRFRVHGNQVHAVTFMPESKTLVVGSKTLVLGGWNSILQFWDVGTRKELRPINEDATDKYYCYTALAFSQDGKLLASGGEKSVRLYDARNGKLLRTIKTELFITSVVFSPDGRTLAYGDLGSTILWESASGKQRGRLPGHWNQRGALAFSPDGKLLASSSDDPGDRNKVIHVWDLITGKELGAFRGHEQPVFSAAFSPDGKHLATASGDATTLIWDLAAVAARGPHPRVDKRSLKSPLDARDLEAAWNDLAGDDAVKAQQAVWMLAREPRQAAAFLGQRLRPASEPNSARIAALIDDLDSDNFAKREQASAELTRLGTAAEALLRKKNAEKITLEMRKRIDLLLEKLDVLAPLSGEELRNVRAVEALELGGTRECCRLLRTLAEGSECAHLTREARASLQRLDRRQRPNP